MSKSKSIYTLRLGRTQPFRRTVNIGTDKKPENVQLVFEPGEDVELSSKELEQCQDLIDTGMIVPADRDAKGRLRVVRERTKEDEKTIETLEAKCDEQAAKIAELEQALAEATKSSDASE